MRVITAGIYFQYMNKHRLYSVICIVVKVKEVSKYMFLIPFVQMRPQYAIENKMREQITRVR